jgi:hypothetical protein
MLQVRPTQQSAVVVQAAPAATQVGPLGGGCRQRSTPCASGTHGTDPQHSAAKVQRSPALMQQLGSLPLYPVGHSLVEPPKQRGIPSVSSLQHCHGGDWQSQQSSRAFPAHVLGMFLGPQTLPRGWQPVGLRHVPTGGVTPLAIVQVTLPAPEPPEPAEPQQSPSFWHRLLVT